MSACLVDVSVAGRVAIVLCCDGMRLGVQVMSACLVDVSVVGRVDIVLWLSLPTCYYNKLKQIVRLKKDMNK